MKQMVKDFFLNKTNLSEGHIKQKRSLSISFFTKTNQFKRKTKKLISSLKILNFGALVYLTGPPKGVVRGRIFWSEGG
jgi:hypothetical protein